MSVDTPQTGWRRLIRLKKDSATATPDPREVTVVDAFSGRIEHIVTFPTELRDENGSSPALTLTLEDGVPHIAPGPESGALVNGGTLPGAAPLPLGDTVTVRLGKRLCFLRVGAEPGWPEGLDTSLWTLFETATGRVFGQCAPNELAGLAEKHGVDLAACAACPQGLDTGFSAVTVIGAVRATPLECPVPAAILAGDEGAHFCPACWLRFDSGDALSIATHEELSGDPVLGPDHRLRFHPTRFNDAGQALDPMGLPAPDIACPHCRRQLPHGYLDTPHRILSVVGAPGAGKSYLLAVLTKQLQDRLYKDFGLSLRDDDPTGNLMLNRMRSRLFSAQKPEEAILSKTALEGAFYERLTRHGRTVAMPRPFVYSVGSGKGPGASFVFYDNAGEHFEPGLDPENSPGAQHVAHSAGIFFLFDPTANAVFRAELGDSSQDPQIAQPGRIDQQDTILSEMDVRIKRMLGLPRTGRVDIPVAVLIGKCDVWTEVFNSRKLPSPVADGKLDLRRVEENSDYLRSLLLDLCPGLVSGAESISTRVRYFAVSALGHSPVRLTEGPQAGMLAPDPAKLKPRGVEHAAYWLFSEAAPGCIPLSRDSR